MELRQLQYFVAVAEERHFGRAAEREHLTQAALSRQVQRLERELDVVLFHRTTREVDLTKVGELFLPQARVVLARAQRAADTVRQARAGEIGELVIGHPSTGRGRWLTHELHHYALHSPGVNVSCLPARPADLVDHLLREEIDVAIVHARTVPSDQLRVHPIAEHPYLLVLPSEHPLLAVDELDCRELAPERLLVFPRQFDPAHHDELVETLTLAIGQRPRILEESLSPGELIDAVDDGCGLALIAEPDLDHVSRRRVAIRPITPAPPTRPLSLIWRLADRSTALHRLLASVGVGDDEQPALRAGRGPVQRA